MTFLLSFVSFLSEIPLWGSISIFTITSVFVFVFMARVILNIFAGG